MVVCRLESMVVTNLMFLYVTLVSPLLKCVCDMYEVVALYTCSSVVDVCMCTLMTSS